MTNKAMPWIKQYPSRLHDVRLAQLHERVQLRFYQLYLLAGLLNANGSFVQDDQILSTTQISFLLHVKDVKQLEQDIATLKKARLIKVNGHGPYIADFKAEQVNWMDKQKSGRERQQRFQRSRASNALVTRDNNVTDASVTPLDKEEELYKEESDKELYKEEEKRHSSPLLKPALEKFAQAKIKVSEKEQVALAAILADLKVDWILKAIKVSIKNNKHSAAYVIGILKNWRAEHANNSKGNNQGADEPAPRKRQAGEHSATSAAAKAKLIIAKRKANVQ